MSSVLSSPPPLSSQSQPRKRRQTKSRNQRQPRHDNALTDVRESEDEEAAETIVCMPSTSRKEPSKGVTPEVGENGVSSTSTNRKPTGRTDPRMPLRTESSSSVLTDLDDSELDTKPRSSTTTKKEKEASTLTSKFFDQSTPNETRTENVGEKKRGKKRQRVNSEGDAQSPTVEPATGSKKPTVKQETPSTQVSLENATGEKRDTKKAPKQKKSKLSPITSADQALPSVPPPAGKQLVDTVPAIGNDSTATANSSSSSSQTARQLAERARTMKEREELTQIRKDKEVLGKKLKEAKGERDEMQKEVEGTRKEVGFKDEMIKSQDRVLDDIRETLTCNVCLECFTDPHTIAPCGHTSCASCLLNWFESDNSLVHPTGIQLAENERRGRTRACATCRTPVVGKPMSAYVLNNLITAVKPRLLDAPGTADAANVQPEADRAKMWDHIFDGEANYNRRWHIDEEDGGIARCNACGNEVEDQECTGCGLFFSDLDPDELDLMDSEMDFGDVDIDAEELLARMDESEEDHDQPPPRGRPGFRWRNVYADYPNTYHGGDMSIDGSQEGAEDFEDEDEMNDFIVDDGDEGGLAAGMREFYNGSGEFDRDRRPANWVVDGRRYFERGPLPPPRRQVISSDDEEHHRMRSQNGPSQTRRPQIISSDDEAESDREAAAGPSLLPRSATRRRIVESDEDDEVQYIGDSRVRTPPPIRLPIPGAWGEANDYEDEEQEDGDLSDDGSGGYGHYRNGYYEDSDGEIWGVDDEDDGDFSDGSEFHNGDADY